MLITDILNPFALIIIGAKMRRITADGILKYYTICSGLLVLFLPHVGGPQTFIWCLNIALTVYFVWFGVFGLRALTRKSTHNKVYMPLPADP
jgi:hypothetical protein